VNARTRRANKLIADRLAVRVIVTQHDGQSFAGLIADTDDNWLLLREAESLLLPRDRIAFIQRP
jgi:hypothetical protein